MTAKINLEDLQLRICQLDGELETIRMRIRLYGLAEIFEITHHDEGNNHNELAEKYVAAVDAVRTCLLQFLTRVSQLQKEAEMEFFWA